MRQPALEPPSLHFLDLLHDVRLRPGLATGVPGRAAGYGGIARTASSSAAVVVCPVSPSVRLGVVLELPSAGFGRLIPLKRTILVVVVVVVVPLSFTFVVVTAAVRTAPSFSGARWRGGGVCTAIATAIAIRLGFDGGLPGSPRLGPLVVRVVWLEDGV